MAEAQIRWTRSDYVKLGQAVANFNKKINKLQAEENKLYLPNEITYKETKQRITTRKELNRIINSLRRFNQKGAEDLYVTEAGEQITKWERNELKIQTGIITRRINKEINELKKPISDGYSRVQMGSLRYRELEAQLKNLKTLESKQGYEFERLRNRIKNVGTSDYNMRRAITYRQNYMEMIKAYQNFDNYNVLINKLNSLQNPLEFYDYVSQNELLADITFMYDLNSGVALGTINDEQIFNNMLESLNLLEGE